MNIEKETKISENSFEKELKNKMPNMIADYILANELEDKFIERTYYVNYFVNKEFVDFSSKASWARCYKINYISQFFFDGLLLFGEPRTMTYDEYDYKDTINNPIEFGKKENIIKPMLLLILQKIEYPNLLFVATCLGIPVEEIDKMEREIKENYRTSEKLKELAHRKQQIQNIRQYMQNIKDGLSVIGGYLGKDLEEEIKSLENISKEIEGYVNELENQINSEEMTLTLK